MRLMRLMQIRGLRGGIEYKQTWAKMDCEFGGLT